MMLTEYYNIAGKFVSLEGKKDGLYWVAAAGEEASPLGPLFARATEEEYASRKRSRNRRRTTGTISRY